MLSGNRTHKTPAAQIAANVALGQFLKACSITLRFTDKLALRRSGSLLAPRTVPAFVVPSSDAHAISCLARHRGPGPRI